MRVLKQWGLATLIAGLVLWHSGRSPAQQSVPVGKGSYAAFPPPGVESGRVAETDNRPIGLVEKTDAAIPSNKWYQNLLLQKFAVGLFALPHRADTSENGISVHYPDRWRADGTQRDATHSLQMGARDFKAVDARAKSWSDWLISFRLAESATKYLDVTLGEGMPGVWTEFKGVEPTLSFVAPGKAPAPKWRATDAAGREITFPVTTDHLGLECLGCHYGVFAPEGARFEASGAGLSVRFAGNEQYLVVCPLPAAKDLAYFHQHAYAIPRETTLSWDYEAAAGLVKTTWKIRAEALRGQNTKVIQGWLSHHWRDSVHDLTFDGREYATVRGKMRCAAGNEFHIAYRFNGVVPNLPVAAGDKADQARQMAGLLKAFPKQAYARDTYAGGKEMVRQANAAVVARQLGDPSAGPIIESLRNELTNWLTHTPGEKDRYFAFYPNRKGLVGFNASFGSEHFTDHHFHYGYFTVAAGMLAQLDATFAADYGPMARLIAKEYANWEREDKRFPFLRTFDAWRGHSFADGNGFPDGNNQESTAEAVQSWTGMILLGEALGDREMTAAGVMGYAMETRATMEYWFDEHGDIFPKEWKHPIAGMVWSGRQVWGTWFTASPAWIYGIQWLPSSPSAAYLARDPKFARKAYETMAREYEKWEAGNAAKKPGSPVKKATTETFGLELGAYMLGYRMLYDPKEVTDEIARLRALPDDKLANNPWMTNVEHLAQSMGVLGRPDQECHADSATAVTYRNEATQTRTHVVWNPGLRERVVTVYRNGQPIDRVTAPPRSLTATRGGN